jgi:hypothetical protein
VHASTRASRTDDYVTLVTRIEGSRAVICNVTLRKSRERRDVGYRGVSRPPLGPPSRLQPTCCVSSRLMVLVSLLVDSLCVPNKYVFIDSAGSRSTVGKREERREKERQRRTQFYPFHGPSNPEERVACLPGRVRNRAPSPECLSRLPILMASNRFEPNGMANV